jgi:GAF domain-containing protein
VPVLDADGELIAVLDVDSDRPAAFDAADAAALEALVTDVFAPRRTASPARASGPLTAGR